MSIEVLNNVDLVFIAEEYLNRVSRSRLNLIARGARSKAELINFYLRSGDEPNTHMRTLENVAERAKLVLERIPTLAMYDKRVPWRFWVFHGTNVENGMPHTHGNVICLNRRNLMGSFPNLLRTVVHERIHVLQRMFPGFWHAQYLKFGWTPVTLNGFPSHWRLNPDLPDLYYEYKGDFGVMTTQGQDLGDGHMEWIQGTGREWISRWGHIRQAEHPAEIWATAIEAIVFKEREEMDAIVRSLLLGLDQRRST